MHNDHVSFIDELPEGKSRGSLEERGAMIVDAVVAGQYDPFEWYGVKVKDKTGNELVFYTMRDALKIDGVRMSVSAKEMQQIADVLGAMLPTPLMTDLIWEAASKKITPKTEPQAVQSGTMAYTSVMISNSERIDAAIGGDTSALVADVGKYWVLTNGLLKTHRGMGVGVVACNYGWHFEGESFGGLRGELAVSLRSRVLQGMGYAHDISHSDYSQNCRLVSAFATFNGQKIYLRDIIYSPDYAHMISHEGPLQLDRQPGVETIACPTPMSMSGLGACPLPHEPGWPAGAPANVALDPEGGVIGGSLLSMIGKTLFVGGLVVGTYTFARKVFA